jgi:5-formyltetrahydrofolate cyclo-ligase
MQLGRALNADWSGVAPIDLYIVGSVAVSTDGTRLGKGKGFNQTVGNIIPVQNVPYIMLF